MQDSIGYTIPIAFNLQRRENAQAMVDNFNAKCPPGTKCGLWADGGKLVLFKVWRPAYVCDTGDAKIWIGAQNERGRTYGSYLLGAVRPIYKRTLCGTCGKHDPTTTVYEGLEGLAYHWCDDCAEYIVPSLNEQPNPEAEVKRLRALLQRTERKLESSLRHKGRDYTG